MERKKKKRENREGKGQLARRVNRYTEGRTDRK